MLQGFAESDLTTTCSNLALRTGRRKDILIAKVMRYHLWNGGQLHEVSAGWCNPKLVKMGPTGLPQIPCLIIYNIYIIYIITIICWLKIPCRNSSVDTSISNDLSWSPDRPSHLQACRISGTARISLNILRTYIKNPKGNQPQGKPPEIFWDWFGWPLHLFYRGVQVLEVLVRILGAQFERGSCGNQYFLQWSQSWYCMKKTEEHCPVGGWCTVLICSSRLGCFNLRVDRIPYNLPANPTKSHKLYHWIKALGMCQCLSKMARPFHLSIRPSPGLLWHEAPESWFGKVILRLGIAISNFQSFRHHPLPLRSRTCCA